MHYYFIIINKSEKQEEILPESELHNLTPRLELILW